MIIVAEAGASKHGNKLVGKCKEIMSCLEGIAIWEMTVTINKTKGMAVHCRSHGG